MFQYRFHLQYSRICDISEIWTMCICALKFEMEDVVYYIFISIMQ